MTTKVPVRVNSYMFPHGTRTGSAASPRLTTAMNCRNAATHGERDADPAEQLHPLRLGGHRRRRGRRCGLGRCRAR